jgi:hypothetical protein
MHSFLQSTISPLYVVARVKPTIPAKCGLQRSSGSLSSASFGIHDISEVTLDKTNKLPRFNMPLELGLFTGLQSGAHGGRICLIFDVAQYRYQKFISDIAGQNIRARGGEPDRAINAVRNWLATVSKRKNIRVC